MRLWKLMGRELVPLALAAALACPAWAQFTQQGAKLVGAGASGDAGQGRSVALSANGNTALVGGIDDNTDVGAAWVYTRTGGAWSQQGGKLVGTGAVGSGANQGSSVALSADGNTALVGGFGDNSSVGAAWIFKRSGGAWTQSVKLVGANPVGEAWQGYSVALSADGNTTLVGGPGDNSNAGAAWVFTRSGLLGWIQQKLVGTGASGAAEQGASVTLSADGNTAFVGGPGDNSGIGATWVFTRSGGTWKQQGSKLVGTGASGAAEQGASVALSGDGNTAVVGGGDDNGDVGAAWVFTRSGSVWTQQGGKLTGSGEQGAAYLGTAVSLSEDGNTAVVGGYGDNGDTGGVWVFTRSGSVWSQQGSKLVGSNEATSAQQGTALALSADGHTAITGGNTDNWNSQTQTGVGAAWVFTSPNPAKIGTYYNSQWSLDMKGNGGASGALDASFGLSGATYVTGDWNGDGHTKIGVYYDGFWYLDYDGNGVWDGGVNDKQYAFGWSDPNVIPVVGDWNGDGRAKIGVYYKGFWFLDYNGDGQWDGGVNDKQYMFGWDDPAVQPMLGDWSGDGTTKIGIYYKGFWYVDYNGDGSWDTGDRMASLGWVATGVTPIVGDWNGSGTTKIGIFYQGFWFLDYTGDYAWDANGKQYTFGSPGMTPLVADWNGSGTAKIGAFYNGDWYLDYNGNGVWDGPPTDLLYIMGQVGYTPIAGAW
jgi:hypothetical protein